MPENVEPGFFKEEFNRLFGHDKEKEQGTKNWTISTLGPTRVGKTILISGLYAQYYRGVEFGKSIGIESIGTELHDLLNPIAKGLRQRPAILPDRTTEVHNAKLKFIIRGRHSKYQKILSLRDHAGEHLLRTSPFHRETIESLKLSDSFLVFIDSRELFRLDQYEASENMELEVIKNLIRDISYGLHDEDIIPISIVLSKSDMVEADEKEIIGRGVSLFQEISAELPKCLFSFSAVSAVTGENPEDNERLFFSPKNIEIPFLFAVGGTVIRNAKILQIAADDALQQRSEIKAKDFKGMGFFEKLAARFSINVERRRLDSKSKRYYSLSVHDIELARSSVDIIKLNKNVTFVQAGYLYDNIENAFAGLI